MKSLKNTARTMTLALPMALTFDVAHASVGGPDLPAPGIFGLIALGVVGALAISRSRK
jgi:MYXO-CTERM domain-containing protein